ncbi:cell division protein FtsW, partial [bacterium CG17_big_fil_post_rev_8_21_14_2_50_64_8]
LRHRLPRRRRFGRCVAAGLTTGLAIYGLVNIGMVLGILPVVGVPLPFISYGGTAMVGCLAAVGLLLGIERNSRSYHLWKHRWKSRGVR